MVTIRSDNNATRKHYRIHRLIALTFLPNPDNLPQVNHIDGNRYNNQLSNLEWCTQEDNIKHYFNQPNIKFTNVAKPIIQMDLDGNEIKKFTSINHAVKELKLNVDHLKNILKTENKRYGGYMWKFDDDTTNNRIPRTYNNPIEDNPVDGELWTTIEDYENYQVSNHGRVRSKTLSTKTNQLFWRYLSPRIKKNKKQRIDSVNTDLCKPGQKPKTLQIRRLVAQYYIPDFNPDCHVYNIDDNKLNNHVTNLRIVNNPYHKSISEI